MQYIEFQSIIITITFEIFQSITTCITSDWTPMYYFSINFIILLTSLVLTYCTTKKGQEHNLCVVIFL